MKALIIQGTVKEVKKIINHLIKDNPKMTVEHYIDKYNKKLVILN